MSIENLSLFDVENPVEITMDSFPDVHYVPLLARMSVLLLIPVMAVIWR